jgi:predicted PurR-regulated permease PerM
METTIGSYVRSELIQAILAAVLLGIGYAVMGLTYPVLLALLGGVAWLIPLAGTLFITVTALLVGFVSGGWILAATAVAYTVVILLVLEFVIEPRLLRRPSGLLVILLMLPLVETYGLGGFVIAPLLAVALQVVLGYAIRLYLQPQATTVVEMGQLEARYKELYTLFKAQSDNEGEPLLPEITSILDRLARLLDETRRLAADGST